MHDVFTKVISQADSRGEYINSDKIEALTQLVADGNKRIIPSYLPTYTSRLLYLCSCNSMLYRCMRVCVQEDTFGTRIM